jgi:hypothetical protein
LALATAKKPLIFFLDTLDQLSDIEYARNLFWLPAELPAHVHVVVSTLPGGCLTALEKKRPEVCLVALDPMPEHEGSALLDVWLQDAGRTLQPHQRSEVLREFAADGRPLYLKLAFEEARRWKSYTDPRETVLRSDIPGVLQDLFHRLSSEANHGAILVSRSLGYLAAAKNGLSEDELLDVLSSDKAVMKDFRGRSRQSPKVDRLPVVVWSRLYFDTVGIGRAPFHRAGIIEAGRVEVNPRDRAEEPRRKPWLNPESASWYTKKLVRLAATRVLSSE